MGKKKDSKQKDPHSDIPGGHALSRLRQMELERGGPDKDARVAPEDDDEKKEGE